MPVGRIVGRIIFQLSDPLLEPGIRVVVVAGDAEAKYVNEYANPLCSALVCDVLRLVARCHETSTLPWV